jgi:hypothetical protein
MSAITQRIVTEIEAAWQYVQTHRKEIEQSIRLNQQV